MKKLLIYKTAPKSHFHFQQRFDVNLQNEKLPIETSPYRIMNPTLKVFVHAALVLYEEFVQYAKICQK